MSTYNILVSDGNGNIITKTVTPPSLGGDTSNILVLDDNNNVYTLSASQIIQNLPVVIKILTVDTNSNFNVVTSDKFNACKVYGGTRMNGTPQTNGTCACSNHWSGAKCDTCDVTVINDDATVPTGKYSGQNCQHDATVSCGYTDSNRTNIKNDGTCDCGHRIRIHPDYKVPYQYSMSGPCGYVSRTYWSGFNEGTSLNKCGYTSDYAGVKQMSVDLIDECGNTDQCYYDNSDLSDVKNDYNSSTRNTLVGATYNSNPNKRSQTYGWKCPTFTKRYTNMPDLNGQTRVYGANTLNSRYSGLTMSAPDDVSWPYGNGV
jgi:hypothetical protein